MGSIQLRSWHRLTLAAVAGGGIALSTILAIHFSNAHSGTSQSIEAFTLAEAAATRHTPH
jgi:hypothetical protein